MKHTKYLTDRLWSRRLSHCMRAIKWMRETFAERNTKDELIDRKLLAEGALRDLRLLYLEDETCTIDWNEKGVDSPLKAAFNMLDAKGVGQ